MFFANKIGFFFIGILVLLCIHKTEAKYGEVCNLNSTTIGVCVPEKSCKTKLLTTTEKEGSIALCSGDEDSLICCAKNALQLNPDGLALLRENEDCGNFNLDRIANGERAPLTSFRWMALLKYNVGNTFRCGGSVISKRFVLTAAHCVYKKQFILTEVRLGEYDLENETDCVTTRRKTVCLSAYEDIAIEKHILHEDYRYGLHHDIALLKLVRDVVFADHITPICLPITDALTKERASHDYYLVAGWGRTENQTVNGSSVLKYTNILVHDNDYCYDSLRLGVLGRMTDGHICAGGQNRHDSCKGDSGGPTFRTSINYDGLPRAVQFGIVSLGVKTCGIETKPAVYTSVPYYMQWITDHIIL